MADHEGFGHSVRDRRLWGRIRAVRSRGSKSSGLDEIRSRHVTLVVGAGGRVGMLQRREHVLVGQQPLRLTW
jgi:hypothetical protein